MLNHQRYQEVITYSFVDPKVQQLIHPCAEAPFRCQTLRPVEMSAMRLSSVGAGLLATVVYNQKPSADRAYFETGLRFVPDTQANLHSTGSDAGWRDLR